MIHQHMWVFTAFSGTLGANGPFRSHAGCVWDDDATAASPLSYRRFDGYEEEPRPTHWKHTLYPLSHRAVPLKRIEARLGRAVYRLSRRGYNGDLSQALCVVGWMFKPMPKLLGRTPVTPRVSRPRCWASPMQRTPLHRQHFKR